MFCSKCGTKNESVAMFCSKCGGGLATESAKPATEIPQSNPTMDAQQTDTTHQSDQQPKRRRGGLLAGLLSLIVFILFIWRIISCVGSCIG